MEDYGFKSLDELTEDVLIVSSKENDFQFISLEEHLSDSLPTT